MSYIPNFVIKKMIPKDSIKVTDTGFDATIINVISKLTIDQIPDDLLNYFDLKIDDQEIDEDVKKGITISDGEGMVVSLENLQDALGITIEVNAKLTISVQYKINKGKNYKFNVLIKSKEPISVEFEREAI